MYDNENARSIMQAAESVKVGMIGTMVSVFVMNFFIIGALNRIIGSIRSL